MSGSNRGCALSGQRDGSVRLPAKTDRFKSRDTGVQKRPNQTQNVQPLIGQSFCLYRALVGCVNTVSNFLTPNTRTTIHTVRETTTLVCMSTVQSGLPSYHVTCLILDGSVIPPSLSLSCSCCCCVRGCKPLDRHTGQHRQRRTSSSQQQPNNTAKQTDPSLSSHRQQDGTTMSTQKIQKASGVSSTVDNCGEMERNNAVSLLSSHHNQHCPRGYGARQVPESIDGVVVNNNNNNNDDNVDCDEETH